MPTDKDVEIGASLVYAMARISEKMAMQRYTRPEIDRSLRLFIGEHHSWEIVEFRRG